MPFSVEQFLDVFKHYNQSVWPIQIAFYILAILAVFLAIRQSVYTGRVVSAILSFFWLWMGLIYHWTFFLVINKAAWLFGGLFILQSAFFLHRGVIKGKLSFRFEANVFGYFGLGLIGFALVIYPIIGILFGHNYPYSPTFGLPCPTTIFTFGILLWSVQKLPFYMFVVPVLWSLVGFTAAIQLGMLEDTGLLIAGLLTVFLVFKRRKESLKPNP